MVAVTPTIVCARACSASFVQDAKKAVGGHVLAHLADWRVTLRKGKGENRIGKTRTIEPAHSTRYTYRCERRVWHADHSKDRGLANAARGGGNVLNLPPRRR